MSINRKYSIYILIAFLLILISFYWLIFVNFKVSKESTFIRYSEVLEDEYNIITDIYSDMADILFKNIISSNSVLVLLDGAYGADSPEEENFYRQELISSMTSVYSDIKSYGVRQLHFHDKNNISFLRMHKKEKFGDDLSGIRASVVYVNKFRKSISGFEEGRIFNGYRNVYPLEGLSGENLGSVEISYSFSAVINQLKQRFQKETQFILLSSLVGDRLIQSEMSNYSEWHLNKYFVLDTNVSDECILSEGLSKKDRSSLDRALMDSLEFNRDNFTLQILYRGEITILAFTAIRDFSGEISGYLFSKSNNHEIDAIEYSFLILSLIFVLLMIFAITFIIYYHYTEKKLLDIILYDQLTCAYSRRMILEKIEEEFQRFNRYHHTFCVVMIDIDHFKLVNDNYGHAIGDIVLTTLSGLILNKIRSTDYFGRYGGEEFLLILTQTDLPAAVEATESLCQIIANYEFPEAGEVTVSCGIVEMGDSIKTIRALLEVCDKNLYKAKNNGRNCVIF